MKAKLLLLISIITLSANIANAQWSQIGTGTTVNTLMVTGTYPSNTIYLGLPNDGVVYSVNYGSFWHDTQNNPGWFWASNTSVYSIVQSGSKIIAGTQNGAAISSNSTCTSWTQLYNVGLSTDIYYLTSNGANFFAASKYQIFLSTNYGSTWNQLHLFNPIETVYSIAVSGTKVYVGASNGVWCSLNNGSTWAYYTVGSPVKSIAIIGTTIFIGTTNGVYTSMNNGASWSSINTGLTNTEVTSIVINGSSMFVGTSGGGVFLSNDNGNSWNEFNTGWSGADLYVVALAAEGQWLYAGNGNGVWMTSVYTGVNDIDISNTEINIYPNPFSSQTTISFSQEQKKATIKIMDVLGKEISTQNFTGKQLLIEKGEMKAGIYFAQIIDGNKNVVNRKIVVQ